MAVLANAIKLLPCYTELEMVRKEAVVVQWTNYFKICLKDLRKGHKNLQTQAVFWSEIEPEAS
jgi:hypothetical protein